MSWRVLWIQKPGELQSLWLHRIEHAHTCYRIQVNWVTCWWSVHHPATISKFYMLKKYHQAATKRRCSRKNSRMDPNIPASWCNNCILPSFTVFQKNIYLCFIDYVKAFDFVDHNQLWKILKEMGIPDHLICLLRNLYAGQEATVRTGHGTTDWFQIGRGVCQVCILSPCLFNFYAEYIMRNAGLEETQAGIKIARRNINHLRYAITPLLWQKVKRN